MFYEQLMFSILDLKSKRPIKCVFKDTEVTLYPNMDGTVQDLVIIDSRTFGGKKLKWYWCRGIVNDTND